MISNTGSGDVAITGNGTLSAMAANNGGGSGGTISITATNAAVTHSGTSQAIGSNHTSAPGSGGQVDISGNTVGIDGQVLAMGGYNLSGTGSQGDGGVITITGNGSVTTGNSAAVYSSGNTVVSGADYSRNKIDITGGSVTLGGRVYANSRSNDATAGDGGLVKVSSTAGDVSVNANSFVTAQGNNGGTVDMTSSANVLIQGAVGTTGYVGAAGDINLAGSGVTVASTGQLLANGNNSSTVPADGGAIQITGGTVTNLGQIYALGGRNLASGADGDGGNVTISAATAFSTGANSQLITTGTPQSSDGINYTANTISVNSPTANITGLLRAHQITVDGDTLTVDNGTLDAGSAYAGLDAGKIALNGGTVTLQGSSKLSAIGRNDSTSPTAGGQIDITGTSVNVTDNARILALGGFNTSGVGQQGQGGVVNMNGSGTVQTGSGTYIFSSGQTVVNGSDYTRNAIRISGDSVSLGGRVYANSRSNDATASDGGLVDITATNGNLIVNSSSVISSQGLSGGQINLNHSLAGGNIQLSGLLTGNGYTTRGGAIALNATNISMGPTASIIASGNDASSSPAAGGTVSLSGANITLQDGSRIWAKGAGICRVARPAMVA